MRLKEGTEILAGLSLAEKKGVVSYTKNLLHDRDPGFFDDKMLEELISLEPDLEEEFRQIVKDCDSVNYNQSKYEYAQLELQLQRFCEPDHPSFNWNPNLQSAFEDMKLEFSKANLRCVSVKSESDADSLLPRKDTHAGFSFIETGKRAKGEYCGELLSILLTAMARSMKDGTLNRIDIIAKRTQCSAPFDDEGNLKDITKVKHKSRLVSMRDIMVILFESVYARPLQEWMSITQWYAGGKNDSRILGYVTEAQHRQRHSITLDYSHFDQSISSWLIHMAFDIMEEAFKFDPNFNKTHFRTIRMDFIHKVFLDGNGKLRASNKGVPSGSMFTQIVDSIVNRLMILTYLKSQKVKRYDFEMMVMGDDNVIFTNQRIDIDHISSYITKNFGISVNSSKVTYADGWDTAVEFLSRKWTIYGVWRQPKVLISKLLFPERFRDYYRNKDLRPMDILLSYEMAFPRAMREIFSRDLYTRYGVTKGCNIYRGIKYLSGLARYQHLYGT